MIKNKNNKIYKIAGLSVGALLLGGCLCLITYLTTIKNKDNNTNNVVRMPVSMQTIYSRAKDIRSDGDISTILVDGLECIVNQINYTYPDEKLYSLFSKDIAEKLKDTRRYYREEENVENELKEVINTYNLKKISEGKYTLDYRDGDGFSYRYTFQLDNDGKISEYHFDNLIGQRK